LTAKVSFYPLTKENRSSKNYLGISIYMKINNKVQEITGKDEERKEKTAIGRQAAREKAADKRGENND
jgi:hypothetical protein